MSVIKRTIGPLSYISSKSWFIAWHHDLQEVVKRQVAVSFAVEVFDNTITVRFINFFDLVLTEEVEDINTCYNAVFVAIYTLKC